jgi:hypothetical protein
MSDPDNRPSRRPPTIDLKATEVGDAASSDSKTANPSAPAVETSEPDSASATPENASAGKAATESAGMESAGMESAAARTETPTNAAAAAPEPATQTNERARRGGGLVANMLSAAVGAIVAAVVLAGALMSGKLGQSAPTASTAPDADAAKAAAAAAVAPLEARLDKIDTALFALKPDPASSQTPNQASSQAPNQATNQETAALQAAQQGLTQQITDNATATKALDDRLAALERRIDEIAMASQAAAQKASAAESAAAQHADANTVANAVTKEDLDALGSRVAAVEDTAKTLGAAERKASSGDDAARLTIAAEALRATVARGEPFTAELAAVRALGVSEAATAKLSPFAAEGLPNNAALARSLATLIPALKRALEPATAATGFIGRLEENAERLVRITPIDAPPGNEPHAVLARLTGDAAREDIAAAAHEVAALPADAKAPAADWLKAVEARDAALAASRQIAADALSALSKPASQ